MAYQNSTLPFEKMLLKFVTEEDPMLEMLKWLCEQMMEVELSNRLGADKSERSGFRNGYRAGYRPRRFDTRMETMYLMVPKPRKGGYIPFFVTERKRSEAALMNVIQEAFVNGVSTRKIEKLAKSLGIDSISKGHVSNITKELNEQVEEFRNRDIDTEYPVLWVDALYEKIRDNGHVRNMAVHVVCGVKLDGTRDILAVEPMYEESEASYTTLFDKLKARGIERVWLVVSDAHKGLVSAARKSFLGSSWQRCKVHFMRNIIAHVPAKQKKSFGAKLKQIWLQPDYDSAKRYAYTFMDDYEHKYPEAIKTLEEGLEDSLQFFNFEQIDSRKIASTNMIERLNREIRRRTKVVGIFPSIDSYIRLVTSYLIEYSEDWSTGWCYIDSKVITLIYEEKLKAALLIMRISLIIPAYNEELLIEKMLISVMKAKKEFEKTKKNQLEIIIVDNNSQDKTVEISKKYDVIVVPEEVHNIARVRNTGARYATGDILCFLDADSEVSTNMFNLVSKYMQTDKYVGGGTKFKLDRRNLTFSLIFVASVLATHIIGLSGVLIYMKKDFFDEIGAFNEQFYAAEDIDFVLRLRELGKQKGLKYCNIYRGYVVTSSRKFKVLEFKDLFMQGGLLLHKSLRESPAKCEQWYNDHDYR